MVNSQIHPATELKITSRPMNTMIWLSTGAFSTGFTITRSMTTPARKENADREQEGEPDRRAQGPPASQATYVENIAISPWAKLKWSVAW